jgi:hypothetical protein
MLGTWLSAELADSAVVIRDALVSTATITMVTFFIMITATITMVKLLIMITATS